MVRILWEIQRIFKNFRLSHTHIGTSEIIDTQGRHWVRGGNTARNKSPTADAPKTPIDVDDSTEDYYELRVAITHINKTCDYIETNEWKREFERERVKEREREIKVSCERKTTPMDVSIDFNEQANYFIIACEQCDEQQQQTSRQLTE